MSDRLQFAPSTVRQLVQPCRFTPGQEVRHRMTGMRGPVTGCWWQGGARLVRPDHQRREPAPRRMRRRLRGNRRGAVIGQELARHALASPDGHGPAIAAWGRKVAERLAADRYRFSPETAAMFCEMLPYCAADLQLAEVVSQAEIVLWNTEIMQAAIAGHESLIGSPPPELGMIKPQIWLRELVGASPDGSLMYGGLVRPILSKAHGPLPRLGIQECDFRQPPDQALEIVPTDSIIVNDSPLEEGDSHILAMHLFLQQEWVGTERHRFPRSFRRRYEREKKPVPEVKTVVLRRAFRPKTAGPGEDSGREYSCQWIVSGHWRRQLCKSLEKVGEYEHRPVYVRPYPKGDPSKPLRAPRPTVYVAKR